MSGSRRLVAAVSALGITAAAVLTAATPSSASAPPAPPTVQVFVTQGHVVRMPTRLRPGVHRFVVRSRAAAAFQLVKPRAGYTKREVSHDVNRGFSGSESPDPAGLRAIKRFERNVVLIGGVSSRRGHRGVMWADLASGKYWALDTNLRRLVPSKILTLTVGGRRVAGSIHGTATLRAIHEVDWASRPRSISHAGLLTFRNDSVDNHFVVLARLAKGKTVADFRRFVDKINHGQDPGKPPILETGGLDSGAVSPGHEMTLRYDLARGRYVLMCFWPDADHGGRPHAFMGMFRGLRLR